MLRKTDRERLTHMLGAAKEAMQFIADCSYEAFAGDRMRQYAVLRAVEIIGEAATHISPAYRNAHPDLPWRDIVGMRNHLVHAYFDIDIRVTWKTVTEDLPPFIEQVEQLLRSEGLFQFRLPESDA